MSVAWLSCHLLQNFDQTSLQVLENRRGNFCTMAFTRIAEQPGQSLTRLQAPVVRRVDSAIHWINHCPLDNSIGFARVYPQDSAIHRLNNWGQAFTKQPQFRTEGCALVR